MRSRQATSRLTCPARMSFTVINRFAMAHLHSHLAVVYHHDSPLPATSPHQLSSATELDDPRRSLVRLGTKIAGAGSLLSSPSLLGRRIATRKGKSDHLEHIHV